MHKSVKVILILMAGLLIIGNMGFAKKTTKSGNPYNDLLDSMFVSQDKTKWLLQIEKFYIDVDDFSIGYDLFLKQLTPQQKAQMTNNSELRTQYFDNYLNYNVLLVKAIEDNFFNDPENQILLRTAVRQAVAQIYLQKNIAGTVHIYAYERGNRSVLQGKSGKDRSDGAERRSDQGSHCFAADATQNAALDENLRGYHQRRISHQTE